MKEVKYQVFISSTYTDLVEERRKVLDVLLMADCIPAGMEAFVATDNEQFEVIKRVIDYCDYYVLIIGKRYGTISPETGKSYTEMEYDYAISQNIPVLVFAIDDSVSLPVEKTEKDPDKILKLRLFREKAMTNRMAAIWKTADDLIGHLAVSIMKAKQEIRRPGWQRAENFDEASLRREIMKLQSERQDLFKEIEEKQKTIDSFSQNSDLAFEECSFTFKYFFQTGSYRTDKSKTISLVEIFKVISLQLLNVNNTEAAIKNAVEINLLERERTIYLLEPQIIKLILNQLLELGLLYSNWNKEKNNLYWGVTAKGRKLRNSLTLINKTDDTNK